MHKLAEICVRRPVFAAVLVLSLVILGTFSFFKLGVDRFPKLDIPFLTITTVMPGSAPEEIETEITDKIEEAVNTVSGIDELRSISSESLSQVIMQFNLEKDVNVAAQEVRDRVNSILNLLPQDVRQPLIMKFDPDAIPVITLALSGPSIRAITEYADKVLRRNLETINGVGQVAIIGGQKRQINVYLDPIKLRAFNVTVPEAARALGMKNAQIPGGTLKDGPQEYTVRTMGRVETPAELERISVATRNGQVIRISDIGRAEDGSEEPVSLSQLDETPAVQLDIRKQSGTNTIEVVRNVRERLEELKKTIPEGYTCEVVRDQAIYIQKSVDAVEEHLVVGSILAAIVVLLFLVNIRTTFISALAIPASIIGAFVVVYYMGYTLNVLTLLALTLSVGIVIDDAIVVLENIFRHIEEKGMSPREAVVSATREIGLAVLSITLSLVAVFLPIAFMEGIVGRFMKCFGITMVSAIVISMLVSFTLTPMLASRLLKRPGNGNGAKKSGGEPEDSESVEELEEEHARSVTKRRGVYHYTEIFYLATLRWALRHRLVVVLCAAALLASVPLLGQYVPKNFIPDEDESEFIVQIRAPEGTSLEATQVVAGRLARDVRNLGGVKYTMASAADTDQRISNLGSVYVRLIDPEGRAFSQAEIITYIREKILPKYRDEKYRVSIQTIDPFAGRSNLGAGIFVIGGPDMKKLEEYSNKLADRLRSVPGAVDVDTTLITGKPQYGIKIDRDKADDLGVSVADIAMTIRLLLAGDKVSDYAEGGEMYDVRLRATPESRASMDILRMTTVPSSTRGIVPLQDVVRIEESTGPAQIERLNRARQVTINASAAEGASTQAFVDALNDEAKKLNMGPEYHTMLLGKTKEMMRAFQAFIIVFCMGFLFAYLVLAAQFESWLHPITVLLALPLTVPFAIISLLLFRQSINIFSILGMLVLFAVVKKNAILQIDHTNQLRAKGLPRFEAILDANRDRLRPILMTTVAFVAGMIPLMFSSGAGAATNKTISSVVVGGQTLSLLFTLIATPVAYSLFDDLGRFFGRLRKR